MADEWVAVRQNVPGRAPVRFGPAGTPGAADTGGFTAVPQGDGGFKPVAAADIGGFKPAPETSEPLWKRLLSPITDIPQEIGAAARENWEGIRAGFDPSHPTQQDIQRRQEDPKLGLFDFGPQIDRAKAMGGAALSVPGLVMSPVTGAARSLIGHPLAAVTPGMDYDEAKHGVDTAMMGLRPGRSPLSPTQGPPAPSMGPPTAAGVPPKPGPTAAPAPPATPTSTTGPVTAMQAARNAAGTIEKIFSPDTVSAEAKQAAGAIREAGGIAARDTATTEHLIEPAWKKINAMPDADRLNFLDYVENRSGSYAGMSMKDPELQALANTLRGQFEKRMNKIQALPSHAQASFIDDYFPHFWKDPAKAQQVARAHGGVGRQGSGASLKKRTVPTIADGIAAGLEPVTTNPLEATLRYVQSMDRFIATTEVFDAAVDAGTIKFIKPKVMGASGHPDSYKVPDGWVKVEGRGGQRADGAQAFAPEGWARVYNNFISKGAHAREEWGKAYDTARRATNATTALELGLSGYHTLTMAQESMVNSVANAVGYARKGKPIEAVKSLGKAAVAPVQYARQGRKMQQIYLGTTPGTAEMRAIVDDLTRAGGRAKGAKHAPDYEFSKGGSYVTALKRGALRLQLAADKADIKASPGLGTAKVAARHIGRIMDTVAQPIFEKYIPAIKNGAFYENMEAWLKTTPNATAEERANAARQIWDSIDNRFGEMVQDNVFWNKALKQAAMLSLRSWSWTVGGVAKELGGATRDYARAPFKQTGGRNPVSGQGRGPNDQRWTQKMDYAIALPLTYAALSAVYQGLKTGEAPADIQDLLAPRTGGVDAATGEPERLMLPGYMKDVFGFYEHPVDEATNKIATAPRVVGQLAQNKNWRGDPILSPAGSEGVGEDVPRWLSEFWKYATETLGPITVRDIMKGKKEGSNLNALEKGLGVRTAPRYLTDPEGYEKMMKSIHGRDWQKKIRYEKKQQQLYE